MTINQQRKATLLVLAGGLGSRYKGSKQVDSMGPSGEYLMEYAIYDAVKAGFSQLVLTGNAHTSEEIKNRFKKIAIATGIELNFVEQQLTTFLPNHHKEKLDGREKPWGTAHATLAAQEVIKNPFVVINSDDFYSRYSIDKAMELIQSERINEQQFGTLLYPLYRTLSENGAVARGLCTVEKGYLKSVVERTQIVKENGQIFWYQSDNSKEKLLENTLVSMNFWVLHPSIFKVIENRFEEFLVNLSGPREELYLPLVINEMISGKNIKVLAETTDAEWFGVTYPEDKKITVENIKKLVENGVYPKSLWG